MCPFRTPSDTLRVYYLSLQTLRTRSVVLVLVSARLWITRNRICFRICLLLSSEAVTGGFTGRWLQDIVFVFPSVYVS